MRSVVAAILTAAALAVSVPVAAQPSSRPKIGVRAYGIFEGESMLAEKSFKNILTTGQNSITLVGAGAEVVNIWKGLFARIAATSSTDSGSRVLVDSAGTVYKLNIPVTIELTPLEIGAGWRFNTKPSRGKTVMVSPYVGVAYVNQSYKETSSFAADEENTDVTDSGQAFFGGVEIGIRFVKIGIEAQYRSIPDALGVSGVSKTFNETNLGGTVFRLTFGVGF